LILVVEAVYHRVGAHWAVQGFLRGLGLAVAGSFVIVIVGLVRGSSFDLSSLVIVVVSVALGARRSIPVPLIITGAALVGAVLYS
jgi:chromate transport protein ChrA